MSVHDNAIEQVTAMQNLASAIVETYVGEDEYRRWLVARFEQYGSIGGPEADPSYNGRFEELTGHGRM